MQSKTTSDPTANLDLSFTTAGALVDGNTISLRSG
jgi:hypothetical protein